MRCATPMSWHDDLCLWLHYAKRLDHMECVAAAYENGYKPNSNRRIVPVCCMNLSVSEHQSSSGDEDCRWMSLWGDAGSMPQNHAVPQAARAYTGAWRRRRRTSHTIKAMTPPRKRNGLKTIM